MSKSKGSLVFPDDFTVKTFLKKVDRDVVMVALKRPNMTHLRTYLTQIESGKHKPNIKMLQRLAESGYTCKINPTAKMKIRWEDLRQYLVENGISQSKLAEDVDLCKFQVNFYLAGKKTPSCERALLIAKYLKVCFVFEVAA